MKIRLVLILSLLIVSLCRTGYAQTDFCNSDSSLNEEQIKECQKRLDKAKNLEAWDSESQAIDIELIREILKRKLENCPVEHTKTKPYIKDFLPEARKIISSLVDERNKQWTDDYLNKIQRFNDALSKFQNFMDEKSQLSNALETLLNQKKRLLSLTNVYLQNMAGIPTTFLIVGQGEWTPETEGTTLEMFHRVTQNAAKYIADNLGDTLVFSEVRIEDAKIVSDVIRSQKSVRVEEFETDPVYHTRGSSRFVLQKYRCYPNYNNSGSGKVSETEIIPEENSPKIKYWNIDQYTFNDANIKGRFPKGLAEEMEKRIDQIRVENELARNQVMVFASRYSKSRDEIISKLQDTIDKIWMLERNIKNKILGENSGNDIKDEIRVSLSEPIKELESLDDEKVEQGQQEKEKIEHWLKKQGDSFMGSKGDAETDISNWLSSRKMIVFTSKSEIMGNHERPETVAERLLKGAVETLDKRKKQLISYELSVVKNGKLISRHGDQYYNDGLPVRYLLFPPVLTYIGDSEETGGQLPNVSLFLAWEVEYSKKDSSSDESLKTSGQSSESSGQSSKPLTHQENIHYDVENDLSWFIDKEECFSFETAKKRLPENFYFPGRDEMNIFKMFFYSKGKQAKEIRTRYRYLSHPDTDIWTRDKSKISEMIYTYSLSYNESTLHDESFCCYIVGVKLGR